jgi:hypothetical protein
MGTVGRPPAVIHPPLTPQPGVALKTTWSSVHTPHVSWARGDPMRHPPVLPGGRPSCAALHMCCAQLLGGCISPPLQAKHATAWCSMPVGAVTEHALAAAATTVTHAGTRVCPPCRPLAHHRAQAPGTRHAALQVRQCCLEVLLPARNPRYQGATEPALPVHTVQYTRGFCQHRMAVNS